MNWSKKQLSCNRMGLKERLGRSWWKDDGIWCENDHLNALLFIPSCCVLVKRHTFVYLKAGWKRARWMELLVIYVFILSQINYVHFNRLSAYVSHFSKSYSCDIGGLHFVEIVFSLFAQINTEWIFDCPSDTLYQPIEDNWYWFGLFQSQIRFQPTVMCQTKEEKN